MKEPSTPTKATSIKDSPTRAQLEKNTDRIGILLVDDEQDVIDIFTIELKKYGYNVDGLSDAKAAIKHFEADPSKYSLVVSDIKMPQMNGFEFIREIRKINSTIPVLFITAFEINVSEFSKVLPSTKIDGFIQKPITPGKLAELIRRHLMFPLPREYNAS